MGLPRCSLPLSWCIRSLVAPQHRRRAFMRQHACMCLFVHVWAQPCVSSSQNCCCVHTCVLACEGCLVLTRVAWAVVLLPIIGYVFSSSASSSPQKQQHAHTAFPAVMLHVFFFARTLQNACMYSECAFQFVCKHAGKCTNNVKCQGRRKRDK